MQPWFFLVAAAALVIACLGFSRRVSDKGLIYGVVGFLALDIVGLVVSLWGFSQVHFLL